MQPRKKPMLQMPLPELRAFVVEAPRVELTNEQQRELVRALAELLLGVARSTAASPPSASVAREESDER